MSTTHIDNKEDQQKLTIAKKIVDCTIEYDPYQFADEYADYTDSTRFADIFDVGGQIYLKEILDDFNNNEYDTYIEWFEDLLGDYQAYNDDDTAMIEMAKEILSGLYYLKSIA